MGKRLNGEGTYGKRKIGKYTYFFYRDKDGHITYGKTQTMLEQKLKEQKERSVNFDKKLTVGEYVRDWFYNKKYKEVGVTLQSTSFDAYEDGIKTRFLQYTDYNLADQQVQALSMDMIGKYMKSLAEKYSRKSIQKTWEVLRMCFTDDEYQHYDLLPKLNYRKIKIPTESNVAVKKRDVSFTSAEDMEILYQEAKKINPRSGHAYGTAAQMIIFIMYSGLRVSEACGLKWKNVDLKNELITIAETYNDVKVRDKNGQAIGRKGVDKSPKTESSVASIPYRERAGEVLQAINESCPNHKPNDYVFISYVGKPYSKRSIEKTFQRMVNNAGLQDRGYTVHSLRHGYGSILYQQEVDLKTISTLLRHADITTTANIYVKPTNNTLKNALKKIDKTQNVASDTDK